MAVTSVTPLTARVDSSDVAVQAGIPFLPQHSMCVPPEAARSVRQDDLPDRDGPILGPQDGDTQRRIQASLGNLLLLLYSLLP